jgi:hypothetical protein
MKQESRALTLLLVLFVGLKLIGHIQWSWLWVLAPIWVSGVTILGIVTILFLFERR